MIDSVSLNSENLVINKGEGSVPSPPPSSTQTQTQPGESDQAAAAVELSFTQETGSTKTSRTTDTAKQLEQTIQSQVEEEKSAREEDLDEQMQETIRALNEKLARLDHEIEFKIDKRINQNYISVIDKYSKEIIREFPPEEIRNFIARVDEFNQQLNASADVKSLIINLEV